MSAQAFCGLGGGLTTDETSTISTNLMHSIYIRTYIEVTCSSVIADTMVQLRAVYRRENVLKPWVVLRYSCTVVYVYTGEECTLYSVCYVLRNVRHRASPCVLCSWLSIWVCARHVVCLKRLSTSLRPCAPDNGAGLSLELLKSIFSPPPSESQRALCLCCAS